MKYLLPIFAIFALTACTYNKIVIVQPKEKTAVVKPRFKAPNDTTHIKARFKK